MDLPPVPLKLVKSPPCSMNPSVTRLCTRDDAVEDRSLVAVTLLAGAQCAEVLGSLGNDVCVDLEFDSAEYLRVCWRLSILFRLLHLFRGVADHFKEELGIRHLNIFKCYAYPGRRRVYILPSSRRAITKYPATIP